MSDYQPKVGDRVRAILVYEGLVKADSDMSVTVQLTGSAKGVPPELDVLRYLDKDLWSFEKLQDPEPKWVNGDVIKVGIYLPAFRLGGRWLNTDSEVHYFSRGGEKIVTDAWNDGKLEFLVKADREEAA